MISWVSAKCCLCVRSVTDVSKTDSQVPSEVSVVDRNLWISFYYVHPCRNLEFWTSIRPGKSHQHTEFVLILSTNMNIILWIVEWVIKVLDERITVFVSNFIRDINGVQVLLNLRLCRTWALYVFSILVTWRHIHETQFGWFQTLGISALNHWTHASSSIETKWCTKSPINQNMCSLNAMPGKHNMTVEDSHLRSIICLLFYKDFPPLFQCCPGNAGLCEQHLPFSTELYVNLSTCMQAWPYWPALRVLCQKWRC